MLNLRINLYRQAAISLIRLLLGFALLMIAADTNAQVVYKTPSGAKYHLADCRTVNNVSEKITLAEAGKLGLGPCKICKPPVTGGTDKPGKAKGEKTTQQCKGITKKGTRCLHMTSIANGYCFQHNPENNRDSVLKPKM